MPIDTIKRFLQLQSASGILLVIATVLAFICANSPGLAPVYHAFLELPFEVKIGAIELKKDFHHIINDGLMAIFFLLVALEIKREVLEGELSSFGQLILPGCAAIGGIIVPAGIYAFINMDNPLAIKGWAIPSATDIAFSLAVLSLLGSRVPLALKVFLTTVAVIDDLAAIVIIAVFYSGQLSTTALIFAGGGFLWLVLFNRLGFSRQGAYFLIGTIIWLCVLKSGVHATLAGVLVGLTIPFRMKEKNQPSLLLELEHKLHPWVSYSILPLFAFANAGVSLEGLSASELFSPVALGITLGLLVGKPIGILLGVSIPIAAGWAQIPGGANWKALIGVAMLTGIGFTMSLFIGMLAFEHVGDQFDVMTKMGVFSGSLLAGTAGYLMLRCSLAPADPKEVT